MPELVLATGNPHKVGELRAILADLPGAGSLRVIGLQDLPGHHSFHEPAESGTTFEQNALIKAVSYAAQTGRLCLADDSGLEIDAIGGRPGVISSHYCTEGHEAGMARPERDAANNARVLRELDGVPFELRSARFVCVMALASPPSALHLAARSDSGLEPCTVRATFEGRIGIPPTVPRGSRGFGYDPLFLVAPSFSRASAELSPEEKNALSHRGAAAKLMLARLAELGILNG